MALDAYQRVAATVNTDNGEFDRHYQLQKRQQSVVGGSSSSNSDGNNNSNSNSAAAAAAAAGAAGRLEVSMEVVNKHTLIRPCFLHMPGTQTRNRGTQFDYRLGPYDRIYSALAPSSQFQCNGGASTRWLVYQCLQQCGGWADRIRGVTTAYVAAALTGRRFAIQAPYPAPLTTWMVPRAGQYSTR